MRFYFKFVAISFLLAFINFTSLFANNYKEKYIVEIGKIDLGNLSWSVNISDDTYAISIKLKSKGFLSNLYKFEGSYEAKGSIVNGSLVPIEYKQLWITKKKKRDVEIAFQDGLINKLKIIPPEKEHARVEYISINNHLDPLSSFLSILMGGEISKTIDGRRIYSMIVKKKESVGGLKINKIFIEDYVNIWADHKKNDLEYIEMKQKNNKKFSMPEVMKIKFKGLLYKLRKI